MKWNTVLAKVNSRRPLTQASQCITKDNANYYIQSFHSATSGLCWCLVRLSLFNNSFKEKLESFQYNACLALTGAIRGTSKEKIYQELGLEPVRDRRWCRKLCLFCEILENENLKYVLSLIPTRRSLYSTRNMHNIALVNTKHKFFRNSFFHQP